MARDVRDRSALRYRRKLEAVITWIAVCVVAAVAVVAIGKPLWLILIALVLVAPYFMLASGFRQWSNVPKGFRAWLHR